MKNNNLKNISIIAIILTFLLNCNLFESETDNNTTLKISIPNSRALIDSANSYSLTISGSDFSDITKTSTSGTFEISVPSGNNRTIKLEIYKDSLLLFSGEKTTNLSPGSRTLNLDVNRVARKVSYLSNGATTGTVPDTYYFNPNNSITISGNTGSLTKTNHLFLGWNVSGVITDRVFVSGDITDTLSEDLILKAVWFDTDTMGIDMYEPDNAYGSATTLVLNAAKQFHTIHESGDQDWFKFNAVAGKTYTFFTSNTGIGSIDTYMYLYDSNGTTELLYNDDGDGLYSVIEYTCTITGTYYVMVKELDSQTKNVAYYMSVIDTEFIPNEEITEEGGDY